MGTHPIFESDIDCLTEMCSIDVPLLSVEEDDLSFENTISKPIKTLDELLAWQEPKSQVLKSTIQLNREMIAARQKVLKSRILICHDMKGGYHDKLKFLISKLF